MQTLPHSITFTVNEVEPARERLAECYAYQGLSALSGREPIACSDYTGLVVENVKYNPLVYAIHLAYADHRPLILSPDIIWLAIAQGIKHHILLHSEELRSGFVSHSGKTGIEIVLPEGFLADSPYAEWESLIAEFGEKILKQIHPDKRGLLIEEFSTTGPRERTAFIVNMMEAFQRYFDYVGKAICGIPSITLEGVPEDWERILRKTRLLDEIGLVWWRERLEPILVHFIRASKGDVDLEHWQSIYKIWKRYGNDKLTGWIINLFPYLWNKTSGEIYKNTEMGREEDCDRRAIESKDPGLRLDEFPLGLSSSPLSIRESHGETRKIFGLSAGFTGIRQIGNSGALKAIIGWAAYNQTILRIRLDEIETRHKSIPFREKIQDHTTEFPGELSELYVRIDRAELFTRPLSRGIRIRPRSKRNSFSYVIIRGRGCILSPFGIYISLADRLERSRNSLFSKLGEQMQQPLMEPLLTMYCIVDLPDKSHVAFTYAGRWQWHYIRFRCGKQRQHLPVIATSAEELLTHLLSSPKPDFPDHGYYELVQHDKAWWELEYRESSRSLS